MRRSKPLNPFFALALLLSIAPAHADAPTPPKTIAVAAYRPLGLLPADFRAFLTTFNNQISPAEKKAFAAEVDAFETTWLGFTLASEKDVRQALADLSSTDPAVAQAARQKLTKLMQPYPSTFTWFRKATATLAPANRVRFVEMSMDTIAARDIWLKSTQDMTAAINLNAPHKTKLNAAAAMARKDAIAIRQSLKPIRKWKDDVTKPDDIQLLAISRLMDFYERCDSRATDPVIDLASKTLSAEDFHKLQHEVLSRMPKKPQVTPE